MQSTEVNLGTLMGKGGEGMARRACSAAFQKPVRPSPPFLCGTQVASSQVHGECLRLEEACKAWKVAMQYAKSWSLGRKCFDFFFSSRGSRSGCVCVYQDQRQNGAKGKKNRRAINWEEENSAHACGKRHGGVCVG